MAKKALVLHMEEQIIDDFRNYCKLNALKLSAKIELLLKQEMENAPANPTLVKLFEELLAGKSFKQAQEAVEQKRLTPDKVPTIDHLRRVKGL